ncbi:MAG TPA: hypothetical protein VKW04_09105 [Planctomycetota bacterium]|nr:hypothetical protein [Planctomycetota bacterium]
MSPDCALCARPEAKPDCFVRFEQEERPACRPCWEQLILDPRRILRTLGGQGTRLLRKPSGS